MSETITGESGRTARPGGPAWLSWTIAVLFGLFFAYDLFEAIGNIVGVFAQASALEAPVNALGWVVLLGGLILPIAAFGLAYWTGRRASILEQAVRFAVALCTVAALSLSLIALFGIERLIDIPVG